MSIDWSKYGGSGSSAAPASKSGVDWTRYGGTPNPVAHESNPFAPVMHAVGAAASGLGRALDAQRWGVSKLLTGEGDPDKQMENLRRGIGVEGAYEAAGHIPIVGHAIQGVADTVLGAATDPLTYETLGAGPLLRATGLGVKGAAAVAKLADTPAGRVLTDNLTWGGEVGRALGPQARDVARGAANVGSSTRAATTKLFQQSAAKALGPLSDDEIVKVGQALNGELETSALSKTEQGAYDHLRRLTELDYGLRARSYGRSLIAQYGQGLTPAERQRLTYAVQKGEAPVVPEPVTPRVKTPNPGDTVRARSRAINVAAERPTDLHPEPITPSVNDVAPLRAPYKMPLQNQAAIDSAQRVKDAYDKVQSGLDHIREAYRGDYMPSAHYEPLAAEERQAGEFSQTHVPDPRTLQREDIQVTNAPQVRAGFDAMAKNLGVQMGAARIRTALGDFVNSPEMQKLFTVNYGAKGAARPDMQKIGDAIKTVVGYPRAAVVSLTPRHAVNILDLLANTDPGALPRAMNLARKLITAKGPAEYEKLIEPGRKLGALAGDYLERKPFFSDFAHEMPSWTGKAGQAYAHGVENTLGRWTRLMTKITWAVDDAAKTVYAQRLAEKLPQGTSSLVAGGRAARELVDYANVAPIVDRLRYVAPFATFRASMPGAVLGGVARNPARAAALNRLTGGAFYGGRDQSGGQWYAPTADVGRSVAKPQDYIRSTLGAPYQAAGTLSQEAMAAQDPGASIRDIGTEIQDLPGAVANRKLPTPRHDSKYANVVALRRARFLTYGNPVDLRWLLDAGAAGIPEAQNALTELGLTPFQQRQGGGLEKTGNELLYQVTGYNRR